MPGAAGRKAANHIYSTAKPDGLSIGAVGAGLVAGPILEFAGSQYDLDKLNYLGSTESGDPYVFVSRKESGFDSLEKLRAYHGTQDRCASRRPPDLCCGRMFAYLLGLERTEDGRRLRRTGNGHCLGQWRNWMCAPMAPIPSSSAVETARNSCPCFNFTPRSRYPKGKFADGLPKAPEMESFAKNEKERQLINLFRTVSLSTLALSSCRRPRPKISSRFCAAP